MKTKTDSGEPARIESLPAAAACMTAGCTLLEVVPTAPGRCQFVLAGPDAEFTAAEYLLGHLEGNLHEFMRNLDILRTAIRRVRT